MGQPRHYSLEIVERCQSLIEDVGPFVADGLGERKGYGGALTTTFLLAMATPMVVLPVERIFKPAGVFDDRKLDENASAAVKSLGKGAFGQTVFAKELDWRFVSGVEAEAFEDLRGRAAAQVFESLADGTARKRALDAPAEQIVMTLRNALAHGGIVYLDKDGMVSDFEAKMIAFVAAKRNEETGKIESLRVLRISEDGFRAFLNLWANWLREAGVAQQLGKMVAAE